MSIELLYSNLLDDQTLIASSEVTSLPAANALNPIITKRWWSDGLTDPEWLKVNIGSSTQAKRAVIAGHNLSSGGTFKLKHNSTDNLGGASDAGTFTWSEENMTLEFDVTDQWWWFHFSDASNPDGHLEVGRLYLGSYTTTMQYIGPGLRIKRIDPSEVAVNPDGSIIGKSRNSQYYRIEIDLRVLDETDRDVLIAFMKTVGMNEYTFIRFDPGGTNYALDELDTMYGYLTSPLAANGYLTGSPGLAGVSWDSGLSFEQAR